MDKIQSVYWGDNFSTCFSEELELILICLQKLSLKVNLHKTTHLHFETMNWDLFLNLADHHKIYPLVYQYLLRAEDLIVPNRVISALRQKYWINAAQALQMAGELISILKLMETEEIRVVVLKGFPLGNKVYGNYGLRPAKDLDILVWPEDVGKAIKVIEKAGYLQKQVSSAITPSCLKNWMKTNHHIAYWHQDKNICLELHWRLGQYGCDIPLKAIENSLVKVKISGQPAYTLGTEELLLFLVLHGAGHAWFRLKWLCDIEALIRQGGFSWDKIYNLSKQLGVKALVNQTIILSNLLLKAPVEDDILKRAIRDKKALSLVEMVLPFVTSINEDDKETYLYKLLPVRSRIDLFLDKFLPINKDIERFPLPECLYFLYYFIRPCTWFGRKVRLLVKR